MDKKVAVVVGAGPGNGASLARRFAAEGYTVAVLSRNTDTTAELAASLPGALSLACDVTDEAAIERAFRTIREQLGPVDALLYNAGSGTWETPDQASARTMELSWRVNTLGLLLCAQQVMPDMEAAGSGSIIVTGATASVRGKPFTTVFAQAKAAQRSLCQSLGRHLQPKGVHVALIILDGMVDLPSTRARMPDKTDDDFLHPDDFATAAWMLHTQPRSAWSSEIDVRPFKESW